jgi:cytochrome c553
MLLVHNSTYDLCMTCHGNSGTGADSNVIDGLWVAGRNPVDTTGAANTADGAALLGGGFINYRGTASTSSHDPTGAETQAWGAGGTRGSLAALAGNRALSCGSCHDPHGSNNYRIIKETVNGTAVAVAQVDEGAAKDYDTEHWGAGSSSLCAACHGAYHETAANVGSNAAAQSFGGGYTHRVDMPYTYGSNVNPETVGVTENGVTYTLPLAESGTNDTVVCMTCHLPHGTSAQMTGFNGGPTADSALLRLDNRGVCEVCHQK